MKGHLSELNLFFIIMPRLITSCYSIFGRLFYLHKQTTLRTRIRNWANLISVSREIANMLGRKHSACYLKNVTRVDRPFHPSSFAL